MDSDSLLPLLVGTVWDVSASHCWFPMMSLCEETV